MDQDTKEFSPEELRKQDGRNGSKVLIAHQGSVYDVSENKLWKTGTHMKRHQAGTDLTDEIKGAPHGPEVLEKVPQVGTLTPEQDSMDENVPDLLLKVLEKIPMLRRHPHPMTVHFPIAFCLTVPLFNFLYLVTKVQSFETTAFYMLILSLLSAALSLMLRPLCLVDQLRCGHDRQHSRQAGRVFRAFCSASCLLFLEACPARCSPHP